MKRLYIIGNGFDRFHDLPTGYDNYAQWLEETGNEVLNEINDTFGDCDSNWWNDFEQNLASVDTIEYANNIAQEYVPDFASDEFHDSDWYEAEYAVEEKLSEIYSDMQNSFTEWISQIDLTTCHPKITLDDEEDSVFLTFNYTDTLESVYHIESSKVIHIHGRASVGDNLILGHGKDYEQLEAENPEPHDEDVEYYEIRAFEGALQGVANKKKPIGEIINRYQTLFTRMANIEEIIILGFSFADVDMPYLDKICESIDIQSVHWIASAYNWNDRNKQMNFFNDKGIQNYLIINDISEVDNVS